MAIIYNPNKEYLTRHYEGMLPTYQMQVDPPGYLYVSVLWS